MRYILLIYGDESGRSEMSEREASADTQRWQDYTTWLTEQGWHLGGEPLLGTDQATSVRVTAGERVVIDGPFAETKEALGGYYIIGVEHLDDAIEAAARCPGAEYGTMEVRPIMELEMPQA
jgi:hypothetical protein